MTVHCTRFKIPVTEPFRLDLTIWALRRRQINIVDRRADGRYSRILVFANQAVEATIAQQASDGEPGLTVTLRSGLAITEETKKDAQALVIKVLRLPVDLRSFYLLAERSSILKQVVEQFFGVRPPRFPSVFEALMNSIACQQVSLESGLTTLNRFSREFGVCYQANGISSYAFPRAVDLIEASEETIKRLGFSLQKARAIKELSTGIITNRVDLSTLDGKTNAEVVEYLSGIRGIGRWSSEYTLLRGLGRLDSFPGDDVGAQNNLQRLFCLEAKSGYDEIKELVAQWAPYQGFVYFNLLLEKLRQKGFV